MVNLVPSSGLLVLLVEEPPQAVSATVAARIAADVPQNRRSPLPGRTADLSLPDATSSPS
jgi:hypothetical protein